jgi:hypothetical protein
MRMNWHELVTQKKNQHQTSTFYRKQMLRAPMEPISGETHRNLHIPIPPPNYHMAV